MYRHLQSLTAFVAVGDTGAFVSAAKRLGVSPSVISHHIARLEDALGETLVHRTTRKLSLSANGQRLYDAIRGPLDDIDVALARAKINQEEVAGALRIALPAYVPDPKLEQGILDFARRYENVSLSLDYTDQVVDLVDGGYDFAIRLGDLPSSTLMRRKLGNIQHLLVATPAFLKANGAIKEPRDLSQIPAVTMSAPFDDLHLTKGNLSQSIHLDISQVQVMSIHGARAATLSGLGFGNLPETLIENDLREGRLTRILPDWSLPALTVQAVWLANSHRHKLADQLVQFLLNA